MIKFVSRFRLAAADQAARARDKASEDPDGAGGVGSSAMGKRRPGGLEPGQAGPSSLFILSENNIIRKTTKFLIEWPYPNLPRYAYISYFLFDYYIFSLFRSIYNVILRLFLLVFYILISVIL